MRVTHHNVLDDEVPAPQRMQIPSRRILEGNALQKDILTFAKAHKNGPQECLDLVFVQAGIREIKASRSETGLHIAFVRIPHGLVFAENSAGFHQGLPDIVPHLAPLHFPPGRAVSVNHALSGDGNVGGILRVDGRKAPAHIQSLEIRVDDRIQILIGGENDYSIIFKMQFNMTLQADGAGEPDTVRHDKLSAAHSLEPVYGALECFRIQRYSIPFRSEIRKNHNVPGNSRHTDFFHTERHVLIKIVQTFVFHPTRKGEGKKHYQADCQRLMKIHRLQLQSVLRKYKQKNPNVCTNSQKITFFSSFFSQTPRTQGDIPGHPKVQKRPKTLLRGPRPTPLSAPLPHTSRTTTTHHPFSPSRRYTYYV